MRRTTAWALSFTLTVALGAGIYLLTDRDLPRYDVQKVEWHCDGQGTIEQRTTCSMSAEVTTSYPVDTLVVLDVRERGQLLARRVISVEREGWLLGRFKPRRGILEVSGLKVSSRSPVLGATVFGFVVAPVGVEWSVRNPTTTCNAESEGAFECEAAGHVASSDKGSWIAVVEVRPGRERRWGLARVVGGQGAFSVRWRASAMETAEADVAVAGIVATRPRP